MSNMKICQEFNSIQEILDFILNVYAEAYPDKYKELPAGVHTELKEIAKAFDIQALFVKVYL